jgi:DNA-binding winged helix-turn-helix (wHTH) protein
MPDTRQWCFGPFRLDPTTRSLWCDAVLLPLPPKPFAVLAYLVTHAGQVVAKETLLAAVWPDTAVTEGVLKTCLAQIRQVLGETARTPQYIATFYRRGYRFVAPITVVDWPATPPSGSARGARGRSVPRSPTPRRPWPRKSARPAPCWKANANMSRCSLPISQTP